MKLQLLAKLSPLAFILCSPLVGQTVYTDPVGAVSVSLAPGNQVLSIPFQKPVLFQGEITSVDGNSISLASLPSISGQAYVQVVSGASAGKIVSIESINASDVLLSAFSFSLSAGDIIQIRNHFTLDDLAALLNAGDGDSVSLLNPDGSRIIGEFWTGFGWEDTLTFDPIGDVVVYPGEGFLFNSVSGGQATLLGSVATHDVSFDLPGGNVISIIGNLSPVSGQTLGSIVASPSDGDRVIVYSTANRNLVGIAAFEYFTGFGWEDSLTFEPANDFVVDSTKGIYFQSVVPSQAIIISPLN